ncbi:MAG: hypothetical protein KA105_00130 [Caulobacter sp.]|nr:hypothetical protein [Caulobacter sp.]
MAIVDDLSPASRVVTMPVSKPTETKPLEVEVLSGEVAITGPDGIATALTGPAAKQSAKRLEAAADRIAADGGQIVNGTEDAPPSDAPDR